MTRLDHAPTAYLAGMTGIEPALPGRQPGLFTRGVHPYGAGVRFPPPLPSMSKLPWAPGGGTRFPEHLHDLNGWEGSDPSISVSRGWPCHSPLDSRYKDPHLRAPHRMKPLAGVKPAPPPIRGCASTPSGH